MESLDFYQAGVCWVGRLRLRGDAGSGAGGQCTCAVRIFGCGGGGCQCGKIVGAKNCGSLGDEVEVAAHEVVDKEPAGQVGIQQDDGDRIAGGDERLGDALVGVALAAIAGHLGISKTVSSTSGCLRAYFTSLCEICLGVVMPASGKMLRRKVRGK